MRPGPEPVGDESDSYIDADVNTSTRSEHGKDFQVRG